MANLGGRPRKFQNAAELELKIEAYFEKCRNRTIKKLDKNKNLVEINEPNPFLITGLCLALDTNRETLDDYASGKYDDENNRFSDIIKKAKDECLLDSEQRLYTDFTPGVIFALKNRYGWKDKQENEITIKDKLDDMTEEELEKEIAALAQEVENMKK